MTIIDVAPAVPLKYHQKQFYSYTLDSNQKDLIGQVVSIPFGRRRTTGVILAIKKKRPRYPLKAAKLKDEKLTAEQIEFARWIARVCHGGLGLTLKLFKPLPLAPSGERGSGGEGLTIVPEKWMASKFKDKIAGTRELLFAPHEKLKEIVVYEPQFPAHKKWDRYPKLHNIDAAKALAKIHGAKLTLQSPLLSNQEEGLGVRVISPTSIDYKQKNPIPLEFMDQLRRWQQKNKRVLLFANISRQDTATGRRLKKFRHDLHTSNIHIKHFDAKTVKSFKSSQILDDSIIMGSSALFTIIQDAKFDHVVWLYPETSLFFPDYRSIEQGIVTLTRLSQLQSGSAPVTIVTNRTHQVEKIFSNIPATLKKEMQLRKKYNYPPYADLVLINNETLLRGRIDNLVEQYSQEKIDSAELNPHQLIKNQH